MTQEIGRFDFSDLRQPLEAEVDDRYILDLTGTYPATSERQLRDWGIESDAQLSLVDGDISVIPQGLKPAIVVAHAVIASGTSPRLHGTLTDAAREKMSLTEEL